MRDSGVESWGGDQVLRLLAPPSPADLWTSCDLALFEATASVGVLSQATGSHTIDGPGLLSTRHPGPPWHTVLPANPDLSMPPLPCPYLSHHPPVDASVHVTCFLTTYNYHLNLLQRRIQKSYEVVLLQGHLACLLWPP